MSDGPGNGKASPPTNNGAPANTGGELFGFHDVTVTHGDTTVLTIDGATLPNVGITMVVGPSGSGKTTLLRLCNRLEVPTTGSVTFRGTDVAALDPVRLRRDVGMVFQHATVLEGTVAENIRVADPSRSDKAIATDLRGVGLDPDVASQPASQLSGGERQRLALVRTLATGPSVLLVDEPTSALDPATTTLIEQRLQAFARGEGAVVWVSHDSDQLARLAEWVVVLDGRQVVASGPANEVASRHAAALRRITERN